MTDEILDDNPSPSEDLDPGADPAVEYSFDGYTLELNVKIALTPAVA